MYFRRGGEIGETDDETQSGSATDIIGTSEVITNFNKMISSDIDIIGFDATYILNVTSIKIVGRQYNW